MRTPIKPIEPLRLSRTAVVVACALTAVGYFLLAGLVSGSYVSELHATPVWLAGGLSVVVVVLLGRQVWPGVLLGALVSNTVIFDFSIYAAGVAAVGTTVGVIVGVGLARRFSGGSIDLGSPRGLLMYAAFAWFANSALAGVFAIGSGALLDEGARITDALAAWVTWWTGDATGIAVFALAVLVWLSHSDELFAEGRLWEFATLGAVAVGTHAFLQFGPVDTATAQVLAFAPVLLAGAVSWRFGPREAVTVYAALIVVGLAGSMSGYGPYADTPALQTGARQALSGLYLVGITGLGSLTADRRRITERLAQTLETRNEFFRHMSHELRTPLNSVIGFSQILRSGEPGPLTEEQERQLGMIETAGTHLLDLVNSLLELVRLEAGGRRVDIDDFDLGDLIGESVALTQQAFDAKGLELKIRTVPAGLTAQMHTDRRAMLEVATNLLSNAAKYTESGGATVTVSIDTRDNVKIKVEDTGVGIRPEELEHIFAEFRRGSDEESGSPVSSGLGLAIARGLARALGGDVTVRSVRGFGSTFTARIPRRLRVIEE